VIFFHQVTHCFQIVRVYRTKYSDLQLRKYAYSTPIDFAAFVSCVQ